MLTWASNACYTYFLFFEGEAFLMSLQLIVELLPGYPIQSSSFICYMVPYVRFIFNSYLLFSFSLHFCFHGCERSTMANFVESRYVDLNGMSQLFLFMKHG